MNFTPLGIGNEELGKMKFTIGIHNKDAKERVVQIRDGSNLIYEERIKDPNLLTQGEHDWYWDGFDNNGILDTKKLTEAKGLNLLTKVWYGTDEDEFDTLKFKMKYKKVDWVDLKINKNTKRVDVTLRVDLKDGGTKGVKCRKDTNSIIEEEKCPWDKIPKEAIKYFLNEPLKSRTKGFEDLKKLALDGISEHWSRKGERFVMINEEKYEVSVNTIDVKKNTMDDVNLTFNTNRKSLGSSNPGTIDGLISLVANIFVPERVSYNVGYIKYDVDFPDPLKGWRYIDEWIAISTFKYTSAHEIGHTILKAYGGTVHSYKHEKSSTLITQSVLPVKKGGFDYPDKGDVDVMKYYNHERNDYARVFATEENVLGLLSLSKLSVEE